MYKRIFILFIAVMVSGCGTLGGEKIKDFSNRSLGYGWLDIKDIDANRLHSVVIYQYVPKSEKPYYRAAVKKFEGGYLYYSIGLINGAFGAYSAEGQFCIGLCGNTIYNYSFGKQGDNIAKVRIERPGVYNFGSYALKEVKTGFFKQGKFEAVPAENGPSKEKMLREILKEIKSNAVMSERVQSELNRL